MNAPILLALCLLQGAAPASHPWTMPAFTVTVDTTKAPEAKEWAAKAKRLTEHWYPIINRWLASDGYVPPRNVTLSFEHMDGIAGTGGDHIAISADWIREHPDDWGMVIHELTHVVQSYPQYDPSWLVEGIADYVRCYRFEPGTRLIPVQAARSTYRSGYGEVATFLDWVQRTKYKNVVSELNAELRKTKYGAGSFPRMTGKSFDELWTQFLIENDWTLGSFERGAAGPVVTADANSAFDCPMTGAKVRWEGAHAFNPAAIVRDGKVCLLYRAEDDSGQGIGKHTSRLGLATSEDGVRFTKRPAPVLYPGNDSAKANETPGGCEDPRLVEAPDGAVVLTYTAWDRKCARLCVATSKDLVHWTKRGPAFAKTPFVDTWSKSGSIVCTVKGDRLVATKLNGKYWMYWGEGAIHAATSPNLIDWTPLTDGNGKLVDVMRTRQGKFDSNLVEPGPPALLTKKGIVLLYNAKNDGENGDKGLVAGVYCAGQALFDPKEPSRLADRSVAPFLKPEAAFERTGQYAAGTVFIEGLVPYKGRWLLYFGCADSAVGMAAAKR